MLAMQIKTLIPRLVIGIATLSSALLFYGCKTADANDPTAGEAFFPVKSVDDSSYHFDSFERKRAIRAYRKLKADLLFELVINQAGAVVNLKLLSTTEDDYTTGSFSAHVRSMKFSPAPINDPQPYRALFYPLTLEHKLTVW